MVEHNATCCPTLYKRAIAAEERATAAEGALADLYAVARNVLNQIICTGGPALCPSCLDRNALAIELAKVRTAWPALATRGAAPPPEPVAGEAIPDGATDRTEG